MEKINVERAHAPGGQATLPGFPVADEDRGAGALASIVVSRDARDERRVWYVVDPDPLMAPHYATHGLALEPGCRVLVDAEALRPVALIEIDPADDAEDADTSTPCGFNPYWDLPPT
jgi:hypothetical protein